MRLARSFLFSGLTSVMARQVAVLLPTTAPRRDLLLTMQYGTPRALQRAGSHTITSIGSTSWVVTWFSPCFTHTGFLLETLPPAATASACALRRSFFSAAVSGFRLFSRRNSCEACFLSKVWVNWLIAGGILIRFRSVILLRWRRTYFGHFTKRVRSRLPGRTSPPMEKVRGFFSIAERGNSTLGAAPLEPFFTIVGIPM